MRFVKRWALTIATVAGFTTGAYLLLNSTPTAALATTTDYLPTCSNTNMQSWNWPDWVKAPYVSGTSNGGNDSSFNPESSSYIILTDPSFAAPNTPDAPNNGLVIVYNSASNTPLTVGYETISGLTRMTIRGATGYAHIVSAPSSDLTFSSYYGSTHLSPPSGVSDPGKYFWVSTPVTTTDPVLLTPPTTSLTDQCVYTARNINYDPSFSNTYNNFSSHVSYGLDAASTVSCSALQVGCWISKALNGVETAFANWFTSLTNWFANLFIPDGTKVKASFDDFNSFMTAKLGFLTFPFTFIVNLYNAFTATTTGCTPYSCVQSFGNYYGSPVSIDFSAPASISHSLMDYLRLAIQGITVVALGFAIYHKYLKIVSKGGA